MKINIKDLVNPHILKVIPYKSARGEASGDGLVLLDANENPKSPDLLNLNRYPDPYQKELKKVISKLKKVASNQIFIGNGSDEIIDLLIRIFCASGSDQVIITPPTFGMYAVASSVNNIEVVKVDLLPNFSLNVPALIASFSAKTKILFLCSPNNPTSNSVKRSDLINLVKEFSGIVIVDEAYIDFSTQESLITEIVNSPNLIILQTLSKACGLAALRVGIAFASSEIIEILNTIKMPYNINLLTQLRATQALQDAEFTTNSVKELLAERNRLIIALSQNAKVLKLYPSDANFLMIQVADSETAYEFLKSQGLLVRRISAHSLVENCLRVSVGTATENQQLIKALELI